MRTRFYTEANIFIKIAYCDVNDIAGSTQATYFNNFPIFLLLANEMEKFSSSFLFLFIEFVKSSQNESKIWKVFISRFSQENAFEEMLFCLRFSSELNNGGSHGPTT